MQNFIIPNEADDNFVINSIHPTTIGYYYPGENPESWSPEEYREKYDTLVAKLRRDIEYKAKAGFFGDQVREIIRQDFANENIALSSVFRSRPAGSQEWSNIGASVTMMNQNGEKEHANIPLPDNINDVRTYILSQITMLIGEKDNFNVVSLEQTRDAA